MHRIPPELKIEIPENRIAQYPAEDRDRSRLLVYDRAAGKVVHTGIFQDITDFIAGDLIILNDTRVLPVRVEGRKPGEGRVEILFLLSIEVGITLRQPCQVKSLITPSRRLKPVLSIDLGNGAEYELLSKDNEGHWLGSWIDRRDGLSIHDWLERYGQSPLPPYIKRAPEVTDRSRYQTVYAHQAGSLAAPTAGLHFTPELMRLLERRGCDFARLSLDVGIGTFQPIYDDDLVSHMMHSENYRIPEQAVTAIRTAKADNRHITSVGTTVVRALESAARDDQLLDAGEGAADLFIYPPYRFKVVERLLTNFHRPDSTLIQLVAAMIGWDGVNNAYGTALEAGFRFYSYGDAMLVL